MTRENNLIGRIDLNDIPSEFPNIEISLEVDVNSDINVSCNIDNTSVGKIKLTDFRDNELQNVFEKDKTAYPIKLKSTLNPLHADATVSAMWTAILSENQTIANNS